MKHLNKYKIQKNKPLLAAILVMASIVTISAISVDNAYARGIPHQLFTTTQSNTNSCQPSNPSGAPKCCGEGGNAVETSIDLGCTGKGNPILDMLFAAIRFLSAGVGVVVVFSTILAGIQYTTSRDNPESTQKAKGRLVSNVIALVVFVFAFSLLNFLIPGGFFNG
ncbi:MAG: hypothetical protein WCJ05_00470 [bacterium]